MQYIVSAHVGNLGAVCPAFIAVDAEDDSPGRDFGCNYDAFGSFLVACNSPFEDLP